MNKELQFKNRHKLQLRIKDQKPQMDPPDPPTLLIQFLLVSLSATTDMQLVPAATAPVSTVINPLPPYFLCFSLLSLIYELPPPSPRVITVLPHIILGCVKQPKTCTHL